LRWHSGAVNTNSRTTALRTLSPLLPNILTTPLPQEILSPSISLHLFPSTHPHLPAVKGRVPYRAALWTAPVAWGCVPIVGNVKLNILSEKIVRTGFVNLPREDDKPDLGEEKLVVRWKTEKKNANGATPNAAANSSAVAGSSADGHGGINSGLSRLLGGDKPIFNLNKGDEFSGMFIFSFDSKGRIATHTIEHADESNSFDKTSKMVTLTDWLLGKAKWGRGREEEMIPGLAMRVCREEWARSRISGQECTRPLQGRW
jgi:Mitochondrial protein up-regulated during meiosis